MGVGKSTVMNTIRGGSGKGPFATGNNADSVTNEV
jgi:hypothetical protein